MSSLSLPSKRHCSCNVYVYIVVLVYAYKYFIYIYIYYCISFFLRIYNNIITVYRFAEFVVQVLAALSSLAGAERAEELYKQSQFDLLKVINAPPKEVSSSM